MENCVFCKIISKAIPAAIIYEDDKSLAFLDINPVTDGHALLIPKDHHQMMHDTPDDLLAHLFIKTKELMVVIKKAMNAEYVAVSIAGTEIPHFHIHLIPRRADDGLAGFWPTKKYGDGEIAALAGKISALT
jgi:histidine triad (HIT) family protein